MQDKGELYILQGMNRISHLTAKEEADPIAAIKHLQAHGRDISIYEMVFLCCECKHRETNGKDRGSCKEFY